MSLTHAISKDKCSKLKLIKLGHSFEDLKPAFFSLSDDVMLSEANMRTCQIVCPFLHLQNESVKDMKKAKKPAMD